MAHHKDRRCAGVQVFGACWPETWEKFPATSFNDGLKHKHLFCCSNHRLILWQSYRYAVKSKTLQVPPPPSQPFSTLRLARKMKKGRIKGVWKNMINHCSYLFCPQTQQDYSRYIVLLLWTVLCSRFNYVLMKNSVSKTLHVKAYSKERSLLSSVISAQLTLKCNSILISTFHLLVRNGKIVSSKQTLPLCIYICYKIHPHNIAHSIIGLQQEWEREKKHPAKQLRPYYLCKPTYDLIFNASVQTPSELGVLI